MKTSIKTTARLEQRDLISLIKGDILALRIFPFAKLRDCQLWQVKLRNNAQLKRYSNAPDVPVNRIGMTLFETENRKEKIEQYLSVGQSLRRKVRNIFGKHNPLDHLIENLNSSWIQGCHVQTYNSRTMNPGIIRSFESSLSGGLPPHVDSLIKDLPDTSEFETMQCQLAANLYFEVFEKGGELELWNYAPDASALEDLYTEEYDFIDTNRIPTRSQKLTPRQGELILFRSNCVHAVKGSNGGNRSAASCFIGYYGQNNALSVWA